MMIQVLHWEMFKHLFSYNFKPVYDSIKLLSLCCLELLLTFYVSTFPTETSGRGVLVLIRTKSCSRNNVKTICGIAYGS